MTNLFANFDFRLLNSPDFKEDSVREVIILPILQHLGYMNTNIVRSKALKHPFLKIGSKQRPINLVPDYLLKVEENYAWVLDAKAPNEDIAQGGNVEQVYSYAIHPEVRTKFFALCNGHEFALFRTDEAQPLVFFSLPEIDSHWDELERYLAPDAFQVGKAYTYTKEVGGESREKVRFDYLNRPLLEEIPVKKRACKRHFGVHGYFTKQSWNIVQDYIRNFSQVGDTVLDPFGGSGVTVVEALMTERKGIHIDLNPMSIFLTESLVAPVKIETLTATFERVKLAYEKDEPKTDANIKKALKTYPYPSKISLPKDADVQSIEELFSAKQLAQLAFLKHLILQETELKAFPKAQKVGRQEADNIRKTLLLMFSGLVTKVNLTFHTTQGANDDNISGGDASAFRYYRYRIAPDPKEIDLMKYFSLRYQKVVGAKQEIAPKINENTIQHAQIVKGTATDLSFIKKESIDYIYTDPPYGKKIPYLDLSTMWNGWLDLPVTEEDFEMEAIEGGEHHKTKESYNTLIAQSIAEMYRVLKFDRWMSFVFAHKDPEFWHLILETAEKCGFEYAGAVAQKNGQTSFKKRQNPFTVLSGQLIINFKKVRKPKTIMKASLGMEIGEIVLQTVEGIIAKNNGATLEQINDELIIKGLELGFLDLLKKEYSDLTPYLLGEFDYDDQTEIFSIKKNKKFKTHVDLDLRIKYYLISYLRRMEVIKKIATFDEICLHIIPLLKNGITPEEQTVLKVLEDIGERVGKDSWQLKKTGQAKIFG
ncbi:MAG: DNA methylase [Bacteroidetes bacterium]|nr:MAG: DNA methylase [Bacteroidota bacterium]